MLTYLLAHKCIPPLLKTYIPNPGPYQQQAKKIYDELRINIISNVYKVRRHTEAYRAIPTRFIRLTRPVLTL
jgi:hypothetical protein